MDRYPPPGWAARWDGNQRDRERSNSNFGYLSEKSPRRNRDLWIERFLIYLTFEYERLKGGEIGWHHLACIEDSYREFRASGEQRYRFQAWVGIRVLSQWLSQLERKLS